MRFTWLAAGSALALVLTTNFAAAYSNQFGPFAEDRRGLRGFDYQSPATFDTKAEVYGDVYGDGFDDDRFIDDDYFVDDDPDIWVGMGPYGYYH